MSEGSRVSRTAPPVWWWLGLAAMALLFALLRVLLEMREGGEGGEGGEVAGLAGEEGVFAGEGRGLTALEALLRSCVPPRGAGAEEWWLWAFFMGDILLMAGAAGAAVWFYARPRLGGLGAAARIPLEDESGV